MKKLNYLLIPVGSLLFVILMASFGGSTLKSSNGAPAGYTNSPADGMNCSHCMGGSAVPVTGWITSDVPATGYVPGTTYTITVTATGTGKKGFEVSPQDLAGNLIGSLTAGSGSKLVGSNKYITHTATKSGNPSTWTFQWTPPPGGAGPVTFYGSIIVSMLNTKTTTLIVDQTTVGLAEKGQPILNIFPNPVRDRVTVAFSIGSPGIVSLDLLNDRSEHVANLMQESCSAGQHQKSFPIGQPAGLYFLKINDGGTESFKKLIIL